ncbi:MAG: hypothetical protein ACOX1P_18340 [Thermoguttaceae bacterium]
MIRPHEEDGVAVVDTVVRSWPPVDSFAIRWDFPAWFLDRLADPTKLRRPGAERQAASDTDGHAKILSALEDRGHGTASKLRQWTGIGYSRMQRLLHDLVASGKVVCAEITEKGNTCEDYSLPPH